MSTGDATPRSGARSLIPVEWQPWAALAVVSFALHFGWEMLQAPLYDSMAGLSWQSATWLCARASAGDAVITLTAYGVVAVLAGSRFWLMHPRVSHVAALLTVGLALTVILELVNVYGLGRWSYGPRMPRLLGIGLAPVGQWLFVPLVSLWITTRYLQHMYSLSTQTGGLP